MADDRRRRSPRNRLDLDDLRGLTVKVILGLLAFVVIGNYVDDVALGNLYTADPGLFTLMGGIIAGLFAFEAIVQRIKPKDDE